METVQKKTLMSVAVLMAVAYDPIWERCVNAILDLYWITHEHAVQILMNVQAECQGRAPVKMHAVKTPLAHSDVFVKLDLLHHADLMCVYGLGPNNSTVAHPHSSVIVETEPCTMYINKQLYATTNTLNKISSITNIYQRTLQDVMFHSVVTW